MSDSFITDAHVMYEKQLKTQGRIAGALETANLLAFYNTPSLYESLDDADRYAIHNEIMQRIGVK